MDEQLSEIMDKLNNMTGSELTSLTDINEYCITLENNQESIQKQLDDLQAQIKELRNLVNDILNYVDQ